MILEYQVTENDYLLYLLYNDSKSKRKKNKKNKSWLIFSVFYIFFSLRFLDLGDKEMGYSLLVLLVIWQLFNLFYYKTYHKQRLKNLTVKYFRYKPSFLTTITFTSTDIVMIDEVSERKMRLSVIKRIAEIKNEFFFTISSVEHLIIPKENLRNVEEVSSYLKQLAAERKIEFVDDLQWKW